MEMVRNIRTLAYSTRQGMQEQGHGFLDRYDTMPNCRSYLLETGSDGIAGTIRVCVLSTHWSWSPIPAQELFPEEINRLLNGATAVVQPGYLSMVPGSRKFGSLAAVSLVRAAFASALAFSAKYVTTFIDDKATKRQFWERVGLRAIGYSKDHPLSAYGVVLANGIVDDVLSLAKTTKGYESLAAFTAPIIPNGSFPETV